MKNDEKLSEVQKQLSIKGAEGFKLINSHIHAAPEILNDDFRFLFLIMEREYYETDTTGSDKSSDDVWD